MFNCETGIKREPLTGRVRRASDDAPLSVSVRLCDAPYSFSLPASYCDFSPAEEPVGCRARPRCRVPDRAESGSAGPGSGGAGSARGACSGLAPCRGGAGPSAGTGWRGARSSGPSERRTGAPRRGGTGRSDRAPERSSGPAGLSGPWGLCRVATMTSCRLPARSIVSRNSWPIGASSTALENSSRFVIGWPSRDTIRSPTRRPASAAGLPALKPVTTRPAPGPSGQAPGRLPGRPSRRDNHASPGQIRPGR